MHGNVEERIISSYGPRKHQTVRGMIDQNVAHLSSVLHIHFEKVFDVGFSIITED